MWSTSMPSAGMTDSSSDVAPSPPRRILHKIGSSIFVLPIDVSIRSSLFQKFPLYWLDPKSRFLSRETRTLLTYHVIAPNVI